MRQGGQGNMRVMPHAINSGGHCCACGHGTPQFLTIEHH